MSEVTVPKPRRKSSRIALTQQAIGWPVNKELEHNTLGGCVTPPCALYVTMPLIVDTKELIQNIRRSKIRGR